MSSLKGHQGEARQGQNPAVMSFQDMSPLELGEAATLSPELPAFQSHPTTFTECLWYVSLGKAQSKAATIPHSQLSMRAHTHMKVW